MDADSNDNNVQNVNPTNTQCGGVLAGPLGVVIFLVLFGVAGLLAWRAFTVPQSLPLQDVDRVFICSETGATFLHAMKEGEKIPVLSPHTNKHTGYPAEACYWIEEDGVWKRLKTPVYVLLNEYVGKKGDTFCPVCGKLVVGHNPPPPPGTPLAAKPVAQPLKPKPAAESDGEAVVPTDQPPASDGE